MKALPLILIAGWGHTGAAMLHLQAALDGYPMQVTSTAELWQAQSTGALPNLQNLSRYALGLYNLLAPFDGEVGVIGWSMGGIVALETARAYSGLFRRLVIIGGTARFCAGNDALPGVSASVVRAMALGLRRAPASVLAAYYDQVHAPQTLPVAAADTQNLAVAPLARGELIHGLDYLQHMDVRNGLDKLTVPTLVVHGREDRIVPWQAGEWLSRELAVSQWRCYEGLGHALPIHAALLLADDIRVFLGDSA